MFVNCILPEVKHEEHQEVDGLSDECWFMSNSSFGSWKIQTFVQSFSTFHILYTSLLFQDLIKVEVVVGEDGTQ